MIAQLHIEAAVRDNRTYLKNTYYTTPLKVANTLVPDKDLLGLCCAGFDIRCMQHEQLYSRLYMS